MKKIAYIFHDGNLNGGATLVTFAWLAGHRGEFQPVVVVPHRGAISTKCNDLGIPCLVITPWSLKSLPKSVKIVASFVREHDVQLIHSVAQYAHLLGGAVGVWSGIPAVWYAHGWESKGFNAQSWVSERLPTKCVLTANQYMLSQYEQRLPSLVPIAIVPLGIDLNTYAPLSEDMREQRRQAHNVDSDTLVIVSAGRITYDKGHDIVLRAIEALHLGKELKIRCYVAGHVEDPLHFATLREQVCRSGLDGTVEFVGFLENPSSLYQIADIVVHASRIPEPFGLVIVEALACGAHVCAVDAGGVSETLAPFRDSMLYQSEKVEELVQLVSNFAENIFNKPEHGKYRQRYQEYALQWGIAESLQSLESAYAELLDTRKFTVPGMRGVGEVASGAY